MRSEKSIALAAAALANPARADSQTVPTVRTLPIAALMLALATSAASAADHLVVLKRKAFDPEALTLNVGDAVEFRNDDAYDHEITSQSEAKPFELDTLSPGQSRKMAFDKPGKIEVECSVHGAMHLTIQVNP